MTLICAFVVIPETDAMTIESFVFLAGMLMDLVSPLFPSAFVFIVCLGSLSRSFSK